jgi:hypothetical protein
MQVSSRSTGVSALSAKSRWIDERSETTVSETRPIRFRPESIGFLRRSGAGRNAPFPEKNCSSADAYTAATKLLNFAPALTRPSRIVWTVTILQQGFTCFYGDRSPPCASTSASTNEAIGNHACLPPAKQLSKGWRFFHTYTHAETSSVLRHSSLGTSWGSVITNAGFDACRAAHR